MFTLLFSILCDPLLSVRINNFTFLMCEKYYTLSLPRPPPKGDIRGALALPTIFSQKHFWASLEVIVAYGKPHVRKFLPSSFNSD